MLIISDLHSTSLKLGDINTTINLLLLQQLAVKSQLGQLMRPAKHTFAGSSFTQWESHRDKQATSLKYTLAG